MSIVEELGIWGETSLAQIALDIAPVLVAAFGIVVAFVAYKLIKRAIGKA